jgi:hypothetical protein
MDHCDLSEESFMLKIKQGVHLFIFINGMGLHVCAEICLLRDCILDFDVSVLLIVKRAVTRVFGLLRV